MKATAIQYIASKGKNYRVEIALMQEENGHKFFYVKTKRLIDFKTRNITQVENVFSVETFVVMTQISDHFIEHPEIKNKILLKELSKINTAKARSSLIFKNN